MLDLRGGTAWIVDGASSFSNCSSDIVCDNDARTCKEAVSVACWISIGGEFRKGLPELVES